VSRLAVVGELTIQVAAEQKTRFVTALDDAPERLELDLAQVTELDSAGLQLLFLLTREARSTGKALELVGHSQAVLDVLALAHLGADLQGLPGTEYQRESQ
jgi:anti-sigma B factor antagonist